MSLFHDGGICMVLCRAEAGFIVTADLTDSGPSNSINFIVAGVKFNLCQFQTWNLTGYRQLLNFGVNFFPWIDSTSNRFALRWYWNLIGFIHTLVYLNAQFIQYSTTIRSVYLWMVIKVIVKRNYKSVEKNYKTVIIALSRLWRGSVRV